MTKFNAIVNLVDRKIKTDLSFLTTKEKFNYLFRYDNGKLYIKNKWMTSCSKGKLVKRHVNINKEIYRNQDIIWIMHYGDIPDGFYVYKIDTKGIYQISNLECVKYKHVTGRPRNCKDKVKRPAKTYMSTILKEYKAVKSFKGKVGVYGIITSDNKIYIGSSTDVLYRMKRHIGDLNKNKHRNKSLQKSWGEKVRYGMIEECEESLLIERENYYIKKVRERDRHNTWRNTEISQKELELLKGRILIKINIVESGCWEFTGGIDRDGYGIITRNKSDFRAHRIMYYANNEDNINKVIRHKCDNRKCCNPDHLESGSYKDNALDKRRNTEVRVAKV